MRLTKTLISFVVVLVGFVSLQAQDLHNSLFYMNPLHMNPAFSGSFEGTYRIGGLYRDQARSAIGSSAYSTPTIFVDVPIIMIGKRNWLGGGVLVFQDQAGDGKLRTTSLQLSGAFHWSMDKKSKNVLTIGAQWGKVGRSIEDLSSFNAGDFLSERQNNVSSPMTADNLLMGGSSGGNDSGPSTDFTDINVGLLLKSKVNKNTDFNIGFSTRHITTPGRDFNFGSSNEDLKMRLIAHAQLNNKINDKWSMSPEIYFSNISPQTQIQLHGWAGYMLDPVKNIKLNFGLGYRVEDSGQVLLGIDYGSVKAALAYDLTLSKLSDINSSQGGFEIAVYYIGKIYKKPDVKPAILCPHL